VAEEWPKSAKPRGELTVGETPVSAGFSASDTEYPSPGDLSVSASETRGWPGNSDCGEDWIRGGSGLFFANVVSVELYLMCEALNRGS